MTNQEIKITSDDIKEVSTLKGEPLYISKYSENTFKHLTLRPYGGDSASVGTNKKIDLKGYTVQFNIPTNTFAISPFQSYYKYTCEFNFKFTKAGRYILRNKKWFFQEATFTPPVAGPPAVVSKYAYTTQPVCVAVAARNAFCVLDSTQLDYSTKTNEDQRIYQQRTYYQNMLSPEVQDKQSSTWFDGNNEAWVVEYLPYNQVGKTRTFVDFATKAGAATHILVPVQKDFIIPFNTLNMALDHEKLEYFNCISGQDVIMRLRFCNTYLSYLFCKQVGDVGDANCIIDSSSSGIIKNELHLICKDDQMFKSDVMASGQIIHKIQPYDVWNVATRTSLGGVVDEPIQRTMKSINDLYLMFNAQEPTGSEWLQYRQDSTFFTCQQIVDITNRIYDGKLETLAPMNFNLKRNGGSDRLFVEDINCLELFRQEILRDMNYTGNNYLGFCGDLSSLQKMQLQDMYVAVNLQQFALDMNVNPIYDGIDNSGSARLQMTWRIGYYNELNGNTPDVFNEAATTYSTKNAISNYDVMAYVNYDAFSCFNINKKTWNITENIQQYIQ